MLKLYYPALIHAPSDPGGIAAALGIARQRGLAVVWVAMPRSQTAAHYLGSKFEARLRRQPACIRVAVRRGDMAAGSILAEKVECFIDNAHLNDTGRVRFMEETRRYGATHP